MAHTCNPITWEDRQEDWEFRVNLSYKVNSRPTWTKWDSASALTDPKKYPLSFKYLLVCAFSTWDSYLSIVSKMYFVTIGKNCSTFPPFSSFSLCHTSNLISFQDSNNKRLQSPECLWTCATSFVVIQDGEMANAVTVSVWGISLCKCKSAPPPTLHAVLLSCLSLLWCSFKYSNFLCWMVGIYYLWLILLNLSLIHHFVYSSIRYYFQTWLLSSTVIFIVWD